MSKIKNLTTNRFVKIDSALGMKLLNEMNQKIDQEHLIKKKIIGKGGYGMTRLVQDKKSGREFIEKESIHNDNENMKYQYNILKHLQKKKICSRFFICPVKTYEKNGKTFILFDYLKNFHVLQDVRFHGLIKSQKDKIDISKNLIRAVRLLHRNKLVHTDIQPLNIMINPDTKEVRIIDFGTAILDTGKKKYLKTRPSDPFSVSPAFKGDAPETFARFKKNDMWALGNLLHLFLFNEYPKLFNKSQIKMANDKLKQELNIKHIIFFHNELQIKKKPKDTKISYHPIPKKPLPFLNFIKK
jgi:serine/threonine protein kinase